ncbi:MAG: multidrug effflux MFS transporter [Verrucomicrobia bacterium]|nr:multidrug effflux MFS transporter [Verrucomicrobiota bacterium]
MPSSAVDEKKRVLLNVPYKIHSESKLFIVLLAAVVMLPSLSIDSCLASLPNIGFLLHAQPAATASILSLFMAGFAVGQIIFGPLCDRLGRRPALLIGCVVFTIAAFGCAIAPSILILVFCRFLQGIGAAAGPVISFAIVRDLFVGAEARKRFAYVGAVAMMAPIVAPTLGGFISSRAGWRAVFYFLAAGGILLGLVIVLSLEESIVRRDKQALFLSNLRKNYWRVISDQACRTYVIVGGLSFGGLFAYVSGSAFVFIEIFKLDQRMFGTLFALNALGIALGALTTGRLTGISAKRMISAGLALGLSTSGMLVLLTVVHALTPLSAMPFLMLNTFSMGLSSPNIVHGTMEPVPEIAGVASSLFGSVRMIAGSISAEVVAIWYNGTPIAMAGAMLLFAASALGCWLLCARFLPQERYTAPRRRPENSLANHS